MSLILHHRSYNPLTEIHREFNQIFNRLWDDQNSLLTNNINATAPLVDIEETEKEFIVHAELPGIKEDDISLEIHRGVLTLKGEKKSERKTAKDEQEKKESDNQLDNQEVNKKRNYHIKERYCGYFMRSIQLPRLVKENEIEAQFNNGVLTITIPKVNEEQNKAQKIAISKSSSQSSIGSDSSNNNSNNTSNRNTNINNNDVHNNGDDNGNNNSNMNKNVDFEGGII